MARLIGDAYIVIYPQTDAFGPQLEAAVKKYTSAMRPTVNVIPTLDKAGAAALGAELKGITSNVEVGAVLDPASAAKVRAGLDTALAGKNSVEIGAVLDPVSAAAMKASVEALTKGDEVKIGTAEAATDLEKLSLEAALLQKQLLGFQAKVKDAGATTLLTALAARAGMVSEQLNAAPADASLADYAAKLAAIRATATATAGVLGKSFAPPPAAVAAVQAETAAVAATAAATEKLNAAADDTAVAFARSGVALKAVADNAPLAETRIETLATEASILQTRLANLRASVDDASAEAKIAALQVKAATLQATLANASNAGDWTGFEAQLLNITAGYEKLKSASEAQDEEISKQTGLFNTLGIQGPGSLIHITDILNASLPEVELFGGAIQDMYAAIRGGDAELPTFVGHLTNVATSAHLTAEAAIEFGTIWGSAAIALTAFGIAAVPTVEAVAKQLQNMNTAATGTGQSFAALARSGESVTAAVRPTVLEAFGTALYAVQNHSSSLASAMATLGQGIDQFAAKAAVAFDSKAAGTFFQQASQDALGLMTSFEQLGSILGTLAKVVPGYAEVLLDFGNNMLKAAAATVAFIEPVLKIGLALHGALLYGGLFGTAASKLFSVLVSGAANALGGIANLAGKFDLLGGESGKLATGAADAATALDGIAAGPVIAGVGLLVGAIASMVIYLKAADTGAKDFNSSLQKSVSGASLGQLQTVLTQGIKSTTAQYVSAQAQLTTATNAGSTAMLSAAKSGTELRGAYDAAQGPIDAASGAVNTYKSGLAQLTTEQTNTNTNLQALANTFHTTIPAALAIANGAQITSSELTASGATNWATIKAQAEGYVTELSVMTAGTGTLHEALNALNVTQATQVTDVQKLTSAWSSWIGIVTGGDSAFTTFEQGQSTLTGDMKDGSSAGSQLTVKIGDLSEKYATLGTSLNGTSTSALAARQAFDQQITAAVTLYGNLQTMATVSGNTAVAQNALAKSGKDLVAQMLPLAAGSQEATAEVYSLAQIAGYGGVDSFQSLAKWVGNTKGAESDLNTQQTILTTSTANLTAAAKNLSAAVGSEITSAEAAAIAKTSNLSQVTLQLAQAVDKSQGNANSAVITYGTQFYGALIKAGVGTTTAKQQLDAYLTQLGLGPKAIASVNAQLTTNTSDLKTNASSNTETAAQVKALSAANADLNTKLGTLKTSLGLTSTQVNTLRTAMETNQGQVDNSETAFVSFAENGLGLSQTKAEALWNQLKDLAGTYKVDVPVTVSGGGTVSVAATISTSAVTGSGTGVNVQTAKLLTGAASGGLIAAASGATVPGASSSVTGDNHLAMVKSGELIIPSQHAPKFADMARKASIPGFAGGGSLGTATTNYSASGSVASSLNPLAEPGYGDAVGANVVASLKASLNGGVLSQALAGIAAASSAQISLAGVSNASAVAALESAAAKAGWTGVQWEDLEQVELKEAGFNLTATNPSSGAYGLAQFINGPSEYALYGGNSATAAGQAVAMINYIKQRYGTPAGALQHEDEFGWYNRGGQVKAHSAGGMVNEPVFGFGANSGLPYSFAERGSEYVGPLSGSTANASGDQLTRLALQQIATLLAAQNKMIAQQPYTQAQALNNASATGVRRGYFATSG